MKLTVKAPNRLELIWLLSFFGTSRRSATKNYRDFVEKVDIASVENLVTDISGRFILGDVDLGKYLGSICGAAVTVRYTQISEQVNGPVLS